VLKKIGNSLLIAVALVVGVHIVGNLLVPADKGSMATLPKIADQDKNIEPEEVTKTEEITEVAPADPAAMGVMVMLGDADIAVGEKVFKKCKACHSIDNGDKNKIGPNLWNIVGGHQGSVADYKYSTAITDLGGVWSFESLDAFLTAPKAFAPGTKMSFKGISKPEARAALIVYLHAQSDSPVPLP
jgi:cytochrome c